ncbi:unnamed protein product [Ceratitis capitata]|uniref:(Mediterranean fruit fly) hypothetical protein n=1 Tax=Ceratitis capitata TaxID=7213 RepID=A0A811UD81_CERCA|nr:unnamed protein product [Ceratitis capitata]
MEHESARSYTNKRKQTNTSAKRAELACTSMHELVRTFVCIHHNNNRRQRSSAYNSNANNVLYGNNNNNNNNNKLVTRAGDLELPLLGHLVCGNTIRLQLIQKVTSTG